MEQILTVQNVGKKYGNRWAVRNVSFSLFPGEILGIFGENGAGKSTLVSILSTLLSPTEGTLLYRNRELFRAVGEYRSRMGYVPQEIALFQELSGYDNLAFFAKAYGISKKERQQRIRQIAELVELSEQTLRRRVTEYSGGMKRKLNIAAALLHQPELLLLDEPTANIDFRTEEQILMAIRSLAKEGTAVVYVGHQPETVEQVCEKICVLKDGRPLVCDLLERVLCSEQGRRTLRQFGEQIWSDKKEQEFG